jgi:hypothetical protein
MATACVPKPPPEERYVLELRALPDDVPVGRRLARVLKYLKHQRLVCIGIRPAEGMYQDGRQASTGV